MKYRYSLFLLLIGILFALIGYFKAQANHLSYSFFVNGWTIAGRIFIYSALLISFILFFRKTRRPRQP